MNGCFGREGLTSIAIKVAGQCVLHTVPRRLRRVLRFFPTQPGSSFRFFPANLEVAFRIIPALGKAAAGLVTITIGRLIFRISLARGSPGLGAVIGAPVGIFQFGIDRIRHTFARQASGNCACYGTNCHADGSSDGTQASSGYRTASGTRRRADRMILSGGTGAWIYQFPGSGTPGTTSQPTDHAAYRHPYRSCHATNCRARCCPACCPHSCSDWMAGEVITIIRIQSFSGCITGGASGKATQSGPDNHSHRAAYGSERSPCRSTGTRSDAGTNGFTGCGSAALRVNRFSHAASGQATGDCSNGRPNSHAHRAAY